MHEAAVLPPARPVTPQNKTQILTAISSGKIGLIEGTMLLGLPDAGWTLDALREAGLWLFLAPEAEIQRQAAAGRDAFWDSLKPEVAAALRSDRFGQQ